MMTSSLRLLFSVLTFALAGCETIPKEPSILALPGSGKNLEQFQSDDIACRSYASGRASAGDASGAFYDVQRRYDFAFVQCMYAKGHKVPVSGGYTNTPVGMGPPPGAAAPENFIPPPSAGAPPAGSAPAVKPAEKKE